MKPVMYILSALALSFIILNISVIFMDLPDVAIWYISGISSIYIAAHLGFSWKLVYDILKLRQHHEERTQEHSTTGLLNSKFALQYIAQGIRHANSAEYPYSMLLIGLDEFEKINQRFGRHGGDIILRNVGKSIRLICREKDIVGHFQGDQFIVGAPKADLDGAVALAKRIHNKLTNTDYPARGGSTKVKVSIGITSAPPDLYDRDRLLQTATRMLKQAKDKGRNRIYAEGLASVKTPV
ncbi:GGDEF domain-containing protein [bacterium]|nr:GGDEF domain-containing protein [candidate division CSSED10-310 bacterium]